MRLHCCSARCGLEKKQGDGGSLCAARRKTEQERWLRLPADRRAEREGIERRERATALEKQRNGARVTGEAAGLGFCSPEIEGGPSDVIQRPRFLLDQNEPRQVSALGRMRAAGPGCGLFCAAPTRASVVGWFSLLGRMKQEKKTQKQLCAAGPAPAPELGRERPWAKSLAAACLSIVFFYIFHLIFRSI